jgi:hypothetical protein
MINEDLWNTLREMSVADVEKRSLSEYNPETQSYRLKILDRDYEISPTNKSVWPVDPQTSTLPDFFQQLAAVNYLIGAKAIPLTGMWVTETQFPSGPLFFRGLHKMPAYELEEAFGHNKDGFITRALSFGGKSVDGGDYAFEFFFFPRLPVKLILWLADVEFPARMTFLFDQSANQHFQLDGLWAVGKALANQLLRDVPEVSKKED